MGQDITAKGGKLGYMPQDDLLFPWLSVRDNALLPARWLKETSGRQGNGWMKLLPIFGLNDHADHLHGSFPEA
jgi:ABC-type nitrate/sulfonate/bicarbonate transport system ATPase subunit